MDQDGGSAHAEPDLERAGWDLEGPGLLVEDALVATGQPASPVLGRPGDAGQAGVGQRALEGHRPLDAAAVGLTGAAALALTFASGLALGGQGGAQKGEHLRAEFVLGRRGHFRHSGHSCRRLSRRAGDADGEQPAEDHVLGDAGERLAVHGQRGDGAQHAVDHVHGRPGLLVGDAGPHLE